MASDDAAEAKMSMNLSVIIPAFNEADYLPSTLDSIQRASEHLRSRADVDVEVIVVDNNSTDDTAAVAEAMGATVVGEPVQGIGRARNRGASVAEGDVLVFVDADVTVPVTLLEVVHEVMSDPECVGGGVDVEYRPRRLVIRLYLRCWRQLARLTGMVQGATQFCRKSAFESCRRLRRERVDRRGRRLPLEPEEAREEDGAECPRRADAKGAAVDAALRQAAGVEGAAVHQPAVHRAIPAVEGGVGRLVQATGTVDCDQPLPQLARLHHVYGYVTSCAGKTGCVQARGPEEEITVART